MNRMLFISLIVFYMIFTGCRDSFQRWEKNLSGSGWRLYLDHTAQWENDTLYVQPVDLQMLPVNPPTCGWQNLKDAADKQVSVPGTVEGYFWSVEDSIGRQMGDYRGVSWWSRSFDVPRSLKGKRLTLVFKSVNLRAEVFVNQKLVGYDLIGNTPFEVNISDAVNFGAINDLDIRITDIGGTFSWDDERALRWGNYSVPSVHGFGGITGDIILCATDSVYIDDIYVQNQKIPTDLKVIIKLENTLDRSVEGSIDFKIGELNKRNKVLFKLSEDVTLKKGQNEVVFEISVPNARLWGIKDPHLYSAIVSFTGFDSKIKDATKQKFGFRFVDIGEKDGDKRLYLNGKRVFILAAMTRGFWPKMGMFPIPGMAERDIQAVIDLGYNMIMYHRAIGQPESMDLCDEKGIMTYEEPGGYQCLPYPPTSFAQQWRKEKLRRMIIRDRSRPSLTNWNIDTWSYNEPNDWDYENISMVHELDPSRIVTFNCIQPPVDSIRKQNPFQLHMIPFDSAFYYDGWFDPYHFAAQEGYVDEYYNNPRYYARYVLDPDRTTLGDSTNIVPSDQIYFLGEEGAFGTQLNLARIKADLDKLGADGWMDGDYLNWYNSYDTFLDESGMRDAFPSVEDLTMKMGHNLHYFHGRMIENTRMMNIADGYVLNGWSGASTNTDIVDTYRHPTGDPSILPYYAQPLYIAVKIRNKVVPAGFVPVADIFLINEKELMGKHKLELDLKAPDGEVVYAESFETEVIGGEEFGQLLKEKVILPVTGQNGHYRLEARLINSSGTVTATGYDDIFVVDYIADYVVPERVTVLDTSGNINAFLKTTFDVTLEEFDQGQQMPSAIVLGMHKVDTLLRDRILEMVMKGTRLIILENANYWIQHLPVKQIENSGLPAWPGGGRRDLNGRHFVGKSSLFDGLPQATAMSWEYQIFYRRGGLGGLRITPLGLKTIVGVGPTNTGTIGIAMCTMPYGQGLVILSNLNIVPALINDRPDCAVAKKLFMNIIKNKEE